MHVQAQPVSGLVPVEALVFAAADVLFQLAFQQAKLQQSFGQGFHRSQMPGFIRNTGPGLGQRGSLGGTHQVMQGALWRSEAAIDREGAGDIGRIAAELGTGIDQHQVAIGGAGIVVAVMQDTGVAAGADDAAVSRPGVIGAEHAFDVGLQFVLMDADARHAHRHFMGLHADVGGTLHQFQLVLRLEQAQLVQQVSEFQEFMRRLRTMPDLFAHTVDPADQLEIEVGIAAEVVIDPRAAFQQAGQDFVQVFDGVGIVHAEAFHRAFLARTRTIPAFALGVAFTTEQDGLAMLAARYQYQHGFGFGKPAQVPEIRILPVGVMRVVAAYAFWGRRQDQDRVLGGHAHQLLAAARELGGGNAGRRLHQFRLWR